MQGETPLPRAAAFLLRAATYFVMDSPAVFMMVPELPLHL
jgi:hypothetical protein